MGPRYSNIGAAQALVRAGAKSIVDSPRRPRRLPVLRQRRIKVAQAGGASHVGRLPVELPVTDANTIVQQLYQAAGPGGGIILDFTADTAPALMKAAIAQGLVDKVKWRASTPIANTFMAEQFGRSGTARCSSTRSSACSTPRKGPTPGSCWSILKKYTKIAPQAFVRRWASWTQVRHDRPCSPQ